MRHQGIPHSKVSPRHTCGHVCSFVRSFDVQSQGIPQMEEVPTLSPHGQVQLYASPRRHGTTKRRQARQSPGASSEMSPVPKHVAKRFHIAPTRPDHPDCTAFPGLPRMLKQTGRPEMVVGWYHSHPGFGCWLSGVDVNTQQSFEALNARAVAVVVDPIQSVKGKVCPSLHTCGSGSSRPHARLIACVISGRD